MKTSSQFFGWKRAVWDSELSSGAKLVLMAISDHANQFDDVCWPGMERLALMCSRTVRSVSDYITEAVEQGWLTKWRRRQPKKQWSSTFYRLSVPEEVARQWQAGVDFELTDVAVIDGEEWERDKGAAQAGGPAVASSAQQGSAKPPEKFAEEIDGPVMTGSSDVEIFRQNTGSATHMQNFPTNTPRYRNKENLSISQPTAVNEEGEGERGSSDIEQNESSRVDGLAHWMVERVRRISPTFAARDFAAWPGQISALRAAGRTIEQIVVLFRWANEDRFWDTKVTSPAKLAAHWDQLVLRRIADKRSRERAGVTKEADPGPSKEPDTKFCAHVDANGMRCTCRASVVSGSGSRKRGYCSTHARLYD